MTEHLREAIAVNRARREVYAELTGGASRWLSRALIWLERLALPVAAWIDRWAAPFQANSIPIIEADFITMDNIAPADTPIAGGVAGREVRERLLYHLRFYRWSVRGSLRTGHFDAICNASLVLLEDIAEMEAEHGCHFAMTKHLIESIGWGALGAQRWEALSSGGTRNLSRWFLWLQLNTASFGPAIDASAQRIHAMGVGIIVNDVPPIPFVESYRRALASAS